MHGIDGTDYYGESSGTLHDRAITNREKDSTWQIKLKTLHTYIVLLIGIYNHISDMGSYVLYFVYFTAYSHTKELQIATPFMMQCIKE